MDFGQLKVIPFKEIDFSLEERGRKIYNNIPDLAISIRENGLINPITVYSPNGQPPYKLICGGRRYLACTQLKLEEVSVRIYDKPLNEDQFRALELYENTKREDLDFSEKVKMVNDLNNLFVRMYGEKTARSATAPGHSKAELARVLGKSPASVVQEIKLAKAMEEFPELQLHKAKNQSAAMHNLKRFEALINTKGIIAKNTSLNSTQLSLKDSFILGDFFENKEKNESFSFIEVDPPYGIDLIKVKEVQINSSLDQSYMEISKPEYKEFIQKLSKELFRLCAPNSWVVFWGTFEWYQTIIDELRLVGFIVSPNPSIWKKGDLLGQTLSPSTNLGSSYEIFIYARKGEGKIVKMGRSNIFDFSIIPSNQKWHPTQRPLELIVEILNTFCWPQSQVLVPFLGSGQTLIAANKLGHQARGYEVSQEFKDSFISHILKQEK